MPTDTKSWLENEVAEAKKHVVFWFKWSCDAQDKKTKYDINFDYCYITFKYWINRYRRFKADLAACI